MMSTLDAVIAPSFTPLFTARIELGPPLDIGPAESGFRRVVPILGGSFAGELMCGEVVSGGSDWQYRRPDGVTVVRAKYLLKTDDGTLIQLENDGFRHGPSDVLDRISAGEAVDPSLYYFRTSPRFFPPEGRYQWLGCSIFVASAARFDTTVELVVFQMA